jgi:hypothetical protein
MHLKVSLKRDSIRHAANAKYHITKKARVLFYACVLISYLAIAVQIFWPFIAFGRNREADSNLILACFSGNTTKVTILLDLGSDPMTMHLAPGIALQTAVVTNHEKILDLLVLRGADPNGWPAAYGETEVVNRYETSRYTDLHLGCRCRCVAAG